MKLPFDLSQMLPIWNKLASKPLGKQIFSRAVGLMAPYTRTIHPEVLELARGYAKVQMRDRRIVRNHLNSLHAIALINLGEICTGLTAMSGVPKGGRGIVTELAMTYKKKARGTIVATAQANLPETKGTHNIVIVADLVNSQGESVAEARATWRIEIV